MLQGPLLPSPAELKVLESRGFIFPKKTLVSITSSESPKIKGLKFYITKVVNTVVNQVNDIKEGIDQLLAPSADLAMEDAWQPARYVPPVTKTLEYPVYGNEVLRK